jgi:hypothetical protein
MPAGVRDGAWRKLGLALGFAIAPVPATCPGGGEPSDVKSVFCCARLFAFGMRAGVGGFMGFGLVG